MLCGNIFYEPFFRFGFKSIPMKLLNFPAFYISAIVSTLLLATACNKGSDSYNPVKVGGVIWGTGYNITLNSLQVKEGVDFEEAIANALNEVDNAANAYNPSSEISLLNSVGIIRNPSSHFKFLFNKSLEFNNLSNGAFDPTVGALVDLWGFGSGMPTNNPTDVQIDSILSLIGLNNIQLTDNEVRMSNLGLKLDFGAIAKGYAVDNVAKSLSDIGIKDFMVEIGGEIRVSGNNPEGEKWTIQIDAPIPDINGRHERLAVIHLTDAAIATSGNYRNFRTDNNGHTVFHTISPITGRPAVSDLLSATIIADNDMTADALATASMVMGVEQAASMIENLASRKDSGIFGAIFVTASDFHNQPFNIITVALNPDHITVLDYF